MTSSSSSHRKAREERSASLRVRFEAHLRRSGLVLPGQRVLVALSGGLDSTVLLDLLQELGPGWALQLDAAHFDHRMRPGSRADARFVAGFCRQRGVGLQVARASRVPRSEAQARSRRYAFLRRAAVRIGADRIATAHHADDQIETVLFRVARGTGVPGLRGIPARRGRLVRPLLPFRRHELAAYAGLRRLEYRDDPSNLDRGFTRNLIRHDLLPLLRSAHPGVDRALLHLARAATASEAGWSALLRSAEKDVILHAGRDAIELARPRLLSYHQEVRARLFRRAARRLGSIPGRGGTQAALVFISSGASGRSVRVVGRLVLERDFDVLRLRLGADEPAESVPDRPLRIPGAGEGVGTAVIGERTLQVRWWVEARPDGADGTALALAALRFPLQLRAWAPGDRIALTYGTKKLKKLFGERRVGIRARRSVPVLTDGEGAVLWVDGLACCAEALPVAGEAVLRIVTIDA
jgi:tRNA(Ile)-lysidine synthase